MSAPAFKDSLQELTTHMMKEEMVLFPYIVRMEESVIQKEPVLPPPFGSVQNPVSMMMHEHDSAGDALRAMRQASAGYTPPGDACISYQTLYKALADFEADLHQHIHLENNILFPRAIAMEPGTERNGERMAALPTRIETQAGRTLTPGEIFEITAGTGDEPLPLAHALHRDRPGVHASAGNISGRLELCWRSAAATPRIRSLPDGSRPTATRRSSAGSAHSSWVSVSIPFPSCGA